MERETYVIMIDAGVILQESKNMEAVNMGT
jgi:hypothetical protein